MEFGSKHTILATKAVNQRPRPQNHGPIDRIPIQIELEPILGRVLKVPLVIRPLLQKLSRRVAAEAVIA